MSDTISNCKKMFYVITRHRGTSYLVADSTTLKYTSDIRNAYHADSVSEALRELGARNETYLTPGYSFATPNGDDTLSIVRVEEVPGSEERVVLGETQQAPAGSVVKYAARQDSGAGAPFFAGNSWTRTIDVARLYETQADAVRAIVERADYTTIHLYPTTILRIAVQPSTPKYIETVLA